ncbi:hypothetical protein Poli38472_008535 [Pythium oligandrum]|uniref:PH domain-containing protein n=1 Tax=Pythium oligandrum TaxID=41045 RepID=A0A8K1C4B7_PYTOL|nr:hypothetical protein Poli38472_008535 [Pythium oligandrum]|eukprot:TMW55887.1 hypothetical protein Poli38472_008535 [Pythium oligandrum]
MTEQATAPPQDTQPTQLPPPMVLQTPSVPIDETSVDGLLSPATASPAVGESVLLADSEVPDEVLAPAGGEDSDSDDDDVDIDAMSTDDDMMSAQSIVPMDAVGGPKGDDDKATKNMENGEESEGMATITAVEGEETEGLATITAVESDNTEALASITAVIDADSAHLLNPANTKDETAAELVEKIKSLHQCESVEVLESGEVMALPKGWSTRASKTHGGQKYYVSPYGQTQWLRPPLRTGFEYKWNHQIEVTFGTGRLGLNLKQISAEPGAVFSDVLVYIAEIYKFSNGLASPAEIYNWGVKPEQRLLVGMRLTAINGIPMTGLTYSEVLDRVNRLQRPIRIKFADITKGIVGRAKEEPPQEETEEEKEARLARAHQLSLRTEYFQILVAYELHVQVLELSMSQMMKKEHEMDQRAEILNSHLVAANELQILLGKDTESLIQETAALRERIEQLEQQEQGTIESPEVTYTAELMDRNGTLDKEIKDLIAENEILRQERAAMEDTLDLLQKDLDEFGGDLEELPEGVASDFFTYSFLGGLIDRGSIDRTADDARERLLVKIRERQVQLEADIAKEEEQVREIDVEIQQFKKQMTNAEAASRREHELVSGEKPPQLISLEDKIINMRKELHDTVAGIAAAAKEGDRARVDNLSIRRSGLKASLKTALDEIQKLEIELNVRSTLDRRLTSDSESSRPSDAPSTRESAFSDHSARLQQRLTSLRGELHEVVTQMAKAAAAKDDKQVKELSARRVQLKEEIKIIQDDYQALTKEALITNEVRRRANSEASSRSSEVSSSRGAPVPVPEQTPPPVPSPIEQQPEPDTARLQQRLTALRADLHDTVSQIAKAASAKDAKLMKELSTKRLQLKEEMKVIQDEYQSITRESLAPPVPVSVPQAAASRSSMSLPPRPSLDRPSADLSDGPRERSYSRSSTSTTASRASVSLSVDSSSNYPAGAKDQEDVSSVSESSMPTLSGLLMKHPSHSNDKGMFGNMSLRGVRERYCVLDGSGVLKYYKRKTDREVRGVIPLDDVALEVVYAKNEVKNTEFSICTPRHQNRFVAKNRVELTKWVEAIERTHELIMQRNNRRDGPKESNVRRQESVVSNGSDRDSMAGRGSSYGLGPMALAAASATSPPTRASVSSIPTSPPSARHHHRATLGF